VYKEATYLHTSVGVYTGGYTSHIPQGGVYTGLYLSYFRVVYIQGYTSLPTLVVYTRVLYLSPYPGGIPRVLYLSPWYIPLRAVASLIYTPLER